MKKKIFLIGFFLLLILPFYRFISQASEEKKEVFKVVKVQTAELKNFQEIREFSGIVKGVGEVEIAPKISGRLMTITKKEGESFKKGELLATVDGSEILAQNSLIKEQKQASINSFSETEDYQDQLVDEAKIELEKAEVEYKKAKNSSSEDDIRIAKKTLEKTEEALKTARKMRDLNLSLAQSQINISQEQVNLAGLQVDNTQLRAPFDGIFSKKFLMEGELVSPQTKIFRIIKARGQEVDIDLPGEVARKLVIGQEVRIKNSEGLIFLSKVDSISPVSDKITRKSKVKFIFDQENVNLGDFVKVLIVVTEKQKTVSIPAISIKKSYYENLVFVVQKDKVREQKVEIGILEDDLIEITSGLNVGDKVVVEGQQNLRNEDSIKIYE